MPAGRWRTVAFCALLGFAGACSWRLARFNFRARVSTDVLDLVPAGERSPELALVRALAGEAQGRVVLFALRDPARPGAPPVAAAGRFARLVAADPAFAEALPLSGAAGETRVGRAIFDRRFELLLPTWLGERRRAFRQTGLPPDRFSAWLAEDAANRLEQFLSRPDAGPMQDLALADPLLLVPDFVGRVQGLGVPGSRAGDAALVWGLIRASPMSEAGQGPVFAAIARATREVRATEPALSLSWTGVDRFAAASRRRIESEIKALNALSLALVIAVGCLFARRLWRLLHLGPVVLCSMLGAWTAATLAFPRLHILVFAIGSLLCGVAIDYGFYLYLQPYLGPREDYPGKLRRLIGPLLASCLTTVAGFLLLLASGLPLLRQIGLFVSAGLISALGAAVAYFALLKRPWMETRPLVRRRLGVPGRRMRRWWRLAALAAAAVAVLGPWRLRWRDDIRELEPPFPVLQANDRAVRLRFASAPSQAAYLTYGRTPAEARRNLSAFLRAQAAAQPGSAAASLGLLFPTEEDYRALPRRLALLGPFPAAFRAALARHGFIPQAFAAFFAGWDRLRRNPPSAPYDSLYREIFPALAGPLQLLYSIGPSQSWFLTVADAPPWHAPASLQTVEASELQSLDALFARYRASALRLSLIGLAVIVSGVFALYPFRQALRIALIPAGSCLFVFGLFGLAGATLNLFHLLGAFLAFCLAHNYSILSSESAWGRTAPPVSIRLSALCAAASFGALALSDIPVVHALGLTVAAIVLTALAAVELEPMLRGKDPA